MARLLAHLFDVTERFGMATRTELLLLQRTMVVVEGVSRSLDPSMNMWTVAKPVVEGYIKDNIGPLAIARDLAETARILSRFGPLLPKMAEDLLIRTNAEADPVQPEQRRSGVIWFAGGVVATGLAVQAYLLF
jgi:ubiquinone biosynthesis protein